MDGWDPVVLPAYSGGVVPKNAFFFFMITLARLTLVEWPDRSCAHIGPVFWKSSVLCVGTMPFNFGGPQRSRWQHLNLLCHMQAKPLVDLDLSVYGTQ